MIEFDTYDVLRVVSGYYLILNMFYLFCQDIV